MRAGTSQTEPIVNPLTSSWCNALTSTDSSWIISLSCKLGYSQKFANVHLHAHTITKLKLAVFGEDYLPE